MNILDIALSYPKIINKSFNSKLSIDGISINSKDITPNNLFIGIIGERFDGAKFFEDAIKNGACGVVVDKKSSHKADVAKVESINYIVVDDSLAFLQFLAKRYVESWKNQYFGKVVCITGSNGKTTTKEMLLHLLSGAFPNRILATIGNLNNEIGVPLTMLRIKKETKIAVIEIGTNSPGEIEFLSKLAMPDFGIITSIGDSHLEKLKNRKGVYAEKKALFDYLFVHSDEDKIALTTDIGLLSHLSINKNIEQVRMDTDFFKNEDGYFLSHQGEKLDLNCPHLTGEYNFVNFSLAIKMALRLGVSKELMEPLIKTFKPGLSRSEWKIYKNTEIFCDYYNANPTSMRNAIRAFTEHLDKNGNGIESATFILGDMYELGASAESFHEEIGEFLAQLGVVEPVFIGKFAINYRKGFAKKSYIFQSSDDFDLFNHVEKVKKYIFLKASRGVKLERILKSMQD